MTEPYPFSVTHRAVSVALSIVFSAALSISTQQSKNCFPSVDSPFNCSSVVPRLTPVMSTRLALFRAISFMASSMRETPPVRTVMPSVA